MCTVLYTFFGSAVFFLYVSPTHCTLLYSCVGFEYEIWFTVFRDKRTPNPFRENLKALGDDGESTGAALPDHVYMDAMGFGMGCCCLQLTFQACNINEARTLYDQLTPLCPIMVSHKACKLDHCVLIESLTSGADRRLNRYPTTATSTSFYR